MKPEDIAPCGMNCSLCSAYQSQKYDLKMKGINRTCCPGCIERGEHCKYKSCAGCGAGKGDVRFCFECEDYPCQHMKSLDKRYRTKYHLSMLYNLKHIKEHGIDAFLEAEQSKWACPNCGEPICCHIGVCLNCDLDTYRLNRRYRWGVQD